jgi:hypothetical protein
MKQYVIECQRPINKLIPMFVKIPECVSAIISDSFIFRESPATKTLFMSSLAVPYDDGRFIQLLFNGAVSLIHCGRRFHCAQVHIELKQPERAVKFAFDSLPLLADNAH